MRTKAGILSLSAVGLALLLSSCQYTKDPNKEWKDRALEAYKEFYTKEENQDLEKDPLFYFDISTFKGVLVRSETDVEYLGQLNFSNFSFSENPNKYFVDFGNVPMTFNDTNDDGNPDSFTFGNYIRQDESGNTVFDVKELMNNLPFVLHEDNFGKEEVKTYSMVKDGGVIEDTSNAKAYDPVFFYISDFSLQIDGAEDLTGDILNFKGKDLAFLRNDLYSIIDSLLNQEDIQNINEFLGLSQTLKNTYRRSVGIPLDQNMPNEITIDGTHYSDFDTEREVVVGPISFVPTLLSHYLPEIGAAEFEPSIYDVETIRIGEGVKTISFYAFYGERDTETGASKSNLKNVYLPSTLQDIQFNAFSNLDLENIYIPKTYTEVNGVKTESSFETVDFGDATITLDEGSENPLELDITTSFGNTSIQNIYFEDYSNLNIQTFPYSTINFADSDARNEAIKIYHGEGDTTKFDKLSDALNTYEAVNPFYQMVLNTDQEKSKFVITSDVSNIAKGKKLYLPYFEYSLSTGEARSIVATSNSINLSDEVNSTDATITLKLDQDLTIEGSLIVGAQVGRSKIGSGDIVGQFSAIDINGHKLTIKNGGSLEGNGLIFDSTNNGEVVVESGGQLTTNLTITNYQDFASIQNRADNGANLFDTYKFNSLKVKTTFNSGSSLLANIDYASQTYVNENKFEYIGSSSNSLFNLESGSLVLTSSGLTGSGSKVSINDASLLTIEDLGRAKKVKSDKDTTIIIGAEGDKEQIKERIALLKSELPNATSAFELETLQGRISRLNGGVAMIKVGAISEIEMREKKLRIEDALNATKSAIEEGVVAGGGVALLKTRTKLREFVQTLSGDEKVGAEIILKAVEEPIRQIARNAGVDDGVVVQCVENGDYCYGYDAKNNDYCDMFERGIIDPVKVTRIALETASSVASTLLTTECVITIDESTIESETMRPA